MSQENGTQADALDQAAQALHIIFRNIYVANVYPSLQQTRAFTALLAMGVMEFQQEEEE